MARAPSTARQAKKLASLQRYAVARGSVSLILEGWKDYGTELAVPKH